MLTPYMREALHLLAEHDGRGRWSNRTEVREVQVAHDHGGGDVRYELEPVAHVHAGTAWALDERGLLYVNHGRQFDLELTEAGWRAAEQVLGDRP